MESEVLEKLRSTPIIELNLDDVSLRRKISRSGFKNLYDLLTLSDSEIDDRFEWDDADAIILLKERYESDPESFARSVTTKNLPADPALKRTTQTEKTSIGGRWSNDLKRREVVRARQEKKYPNGAMVFPPLPFSKELKAFEIRAGSELDRLADQFDRVLVYQTFDEFATELDEIDELFQSLFEHYKSKPRYAMLLIDSFLRNIFLVYVANRARKEYDGGNLWGNLFGKIGVADGNVQNEFKNVFVQQLEYRNMPLYAANEEANYYFYTALLHGGLSADSWENLWIKSLMPLVREITEGDYGFGGEMDGRTILKEIKKPESRFAPKQSVLKILEKAPDFTIAPLFEASLRVAAQVESASKSDSDLTMLTSYGLPDIAMQALYSGREKRSKSRKPNRTVNSSRHKVETSKKMYLTEARLQLDLDQGLVFLKWNKQQFAPDFICDRLDYFVDGVLQESQKFEARVGKCILNAVSISVEPQSRYDIELKLMGQTYDGKWTEKGSLKQSFSRSKPKCFEFIQDASGLYRLRGKNERITRSRRIAYIVKGGYGIEPNQGMTPIEVRDTVDTWGGAQILVYDVEPGASAAVINLSTREEIAIWQERYSAQIDKRRVIGETASGLDLYGYIPCRLGTNGGLPSVSIEAVDGQDALYDLDIHCLCDDRRVSVPRRVLWEEDVDGSDSARIALILSESSLFDHHIKLCELEARQRSAGGKVVFRYRFAVIPIQGFRLSSIGIEFGTPVADYEFQARLPLRVTDTQERERNVDKWSYYNARTLLRDEYLDLRIETVNDGKSADVKLALAALEVELPKRLIEIARKRPVCLADAFELGSACGNVKVTSLGFRRNRAAMSFMGETPMFFKELKWPGEHSFNIFGHKDVFVQGDNSLPRDKLLKLSIVYGDDISEGFRKPAWTDVSLLPCREGFGFSSWKVLEKSDGTHILELDAPTLHKIRLDFKIKISGFHVGKVDIFEGESVAILPKAVVRYLDSRKKLVMTITPMSWFDSLEHEYKAEFNFNR